VSPGDEFAAVKVAPEFNTLQQRLAAGQPTPLKDLLSLG
jgi:hypothetical protein